MQELCRSSLFCMKLPLKTFRLLSCSFKRAAVAHCDVAKAYVPTVIAPNE